MATRETPLSMAYRAEAVISLEVQMSSLWLKHFDDEKNNQGLRLCTKIQDEKHDKALTRMISQKQEIARHYNSKVK